MVNAMLDVSIVAAVSMPSIEKSVNDARIWNVPVGEGWLVGEFQKLRAFQKLGRDMPKVWFRQPSGSRVT